MLSAWRTRRLSLHRSASTVKVERPGSPVSLTTESDESSDDDDDSDAFYDAAEPIDERLPSFFLPRRSTFRRNVWTTDSIDIGVTSVVPSQSHTFEISLLFPHAGRLWKVQRRLSEFAALHTALEASYGTAMQERGIHLPRAPRLGWGNNATADDPAALHMMLKLNTYLRKLVEVNDIVDDSVFREFLTPRPLSRTDVEVRSKTLPSLETTHSARHAMTEILNMKSCPSVQLNENAKAVDSLCDQAIHFGSGIQLRALGGLRVGLTKRGGLSGSHKIAAVAAGLAGMALTGPLSAAFALGAVGGGMGKYQMNKNFYLTLNKPRNHAFRSSGSTSTVQDGNSHANGWFVVENAELVTGPRRAVKYGDLIHLYCRNLRKNVALGQPPDSRHGHLMVANQDTKRTTLRLVSPYGHKGEIVCGSQVYLQVLDGQWSGQYMSLQADAIATGNSPAMFKICQQYHACAASEDTITVPRTLTQQQLEDLPPFKLRVMVYNVWLFPSILTALNDSICPSTMQRAQAIPQCLGALDVDVVVFCEAFCSTAREILIKGMKEQGFLYETKVVGEGASVTTKKAIDGGCFAMSKYPMERFEELTFGSMAVGDDRMSDKGVIYFQVRVPQGETVHVFGTHLQAWETKVAIAARKNQLRALREFIDSKQIPPQDAVIVAGDLNVDQCGEDIKEYEEMLELLDANDVQLAKSSSPYSFDPLTNKLAVSGLSSGGHTERLDYILSTRNHRQPTRSEAQIVQLKATQHWTVPSDALKAEHLVDLSDHYPVVADFQF